MKTEETIGDTLLNQLAVVLPLEKSLGELTAVILRVKAGLDDDVAFVAAQPITITSDAEAEALADKVRAAKDVADDIRRRHENIKKFADQLHKVVCAQEKALLQPIAAWIDGGPGKNGASHAIAAWDLEQRRKREKEQQEAQAALDRQHAKDTEKTAKALEKQGEADMADQVRQQAPYTRPVAYVPPVARPAGVSLPTALKYDFEITDPAAVPRMYCKPDEAKIKAQVKVLGKDAVGAIAGVRVFPLDPKATVRR